MGDCEISMFESTWLTERTAALSIPTHLRGGPFLARKIMSTRRVLLHIHNITRIIGLFLPVSSLDLISFHSCHSTYLAIELPSHSIHAVNSRCAVQSMKSRRCGG